MNPVFIGLAALMAYSLFLSLRGLGRLYRRQEKKMAFFILLFLLLVPALVCVAFLVPDASRFHFWVTTPAIILTIFWALTGFFLDSYLKKEQLAAEQQQLMGEAAPAELPKPTPSAHWQPKAWGTLAAAVAIWSLGVVLNPADRTLRGIMIGISMFLAIVAISSFWRWRKF